MYAIWTVRSTMNITELTARWLQESLGVFNEETLELYRGLLDNHVIPAFGDRETVSREEILAFREEKLAQGISESTAYMMVRVLGRILEYGASIGECPAPDWDLGLGTPKRSRGVAILTPTEERQVCSYLIENPTPMHLCIFLILTTGMGVGEVLGIQWKDVSVARNFIRVHVSRGPITGRKHRTRKVTIGERQRIYLRKMASQPDNYLSSSTPKPRQRAALESRWRKVVDERLLERISLMELRHTYVMRCIESGLDYETISKRIGVINGGSFRRFYRSLAPAEQAERLERERFENRKVRQAPTTRRPSEKDPDVEVLEEKVEDRKKRLRQTLDCLEGDLSIINALRYSDCVQGANRQGLYSFIEKVLGDDKDGKFLVEYLRCNMRVAEMPLLKVTTVQAIRRRVTHGFEKLNKRLDEIYAVEGWEAVPTLEKMCSRIMAVAPPEPKRTGPKGKDALEKRCKKALEALDRLQAENESLKAELASVRGPEAAGPRGLSAR